MTISDDLLFAVTLSTALACGLMAGVFFAFSAFVMKGLNREPAGVAIAAMQSINIAAYNPAFSIVFFGTIVSCLLAIILSMLRWGDPGAPYSLIGGVLYLVGTALMTGLYHIPKNNALDSASSNDPNAAGIWSDYSATWTLGNHVRAAAALGSAALLTVAVC